MKFSYNWLQSFFQKKLPRPEKLAEILTMSFAEVEEVKASSSRFACAREVEEVKAFSPRFAYAREVEEVKKTAADFILNIDVRPNRAGDCFSHLGIAREISVLLNAKYKTTNTRFFENKKIRTKDFISVEVENKAVCPRYTVRIVTDVKVGPSPKWLKERLITCGLRPINNIVDIANYVMLETGQPLHAFDFEKIERAKKVNPLLSSSLMLGSVNPKSEILNPKQIQNPKFRIPNLPKKLIVRFAKKGERITALDEEKYDLDEGVLVIADEKKPVAIAGIKGGKSSEIDEKTKTVILESANFNSKITRKGSQKLNLRTDASIRFEHGIDPNLTEIAINRAAYLIQKIAKGKIAMGLVDTYPKKVLPKRIRLDLNYVERLLGVKISEKEIKNILQRLGFKILDLKAEPSDSWARREKRTRFSATFKILNIEVPTRRLDVSIQEDLIEEIGRVYGYEKIPAQFPVAALVPPKRNLDIFWEDMVKNILKEAGFTEVYNYSFFGKREAELFGYREIDLVEVENPLSQEHRYLRTSLIPNLLKNIEKNFRDFKKIKIFELGKIFKTPSLEKRRLSGLMLGEEGKPSSTPVAKARAGEEFQYLKGIIDTLLERLGIVGLWCVEHRPTAEESKQFIWHPKKCAEIKINNEEIGFLGEISPKILSELGIKNKVILFDIDFEKLSRLASEEQEYRPLSKYPSAVRDIAVLVPREVKVDKVLNKIYDVGKELIRDVELFDIYEGEELPYGKKNLAFHIIYQAQDRTFSSKEIDQLQSKIISNLEKEPEWQVRSQ